MVDYSHYFDRRDEFISAYKLAGSDTLRDLLLQAVFYTDLSMATFRDYVLALSAGLNRLGKMQEKFSKWKPEAIARTEQMRKIMEPTAESLARDKELRDLAGSDESLKERYVKYQTLMEAGKRQMAKLLAASNEANQSAEILQSVIIRLNVFYLELTKGELAGSLFEEVFKGRTSKFVKEALIKIVSYLIGISPVGWFADAIQTTKDIYLARVDEVNAADDYIKYLETYSITATHWSVATQVVIDTIDRLAQDEPMQLEESAERIKQRIEELKINWNYETPILGR